MSSASGRKSRNLREATYHLREEALKRYRNKHKGEDPPIDWEPTTDEQDAIIRALSPPNLSPDPALLAAQSEGAFEGLGTPRGTAAAPPTPNIIYSTHPDTADTVECLDGKVLAQSQLIECAAPLTQDVRNGETFDQLPIIIPSTADRSRGTHQCLSIQLSQTDACNPSTLALHINITLISACTNGALG